MAKQVTEWCSFCSKPNDDKMEMIIAGVNAFICDECVDLCTEIVAQKRHRVMIAEDIGL